jgi:hypothetical protein
MFGCPWSEAWLQEAAGKGYGLAQHNLAAGPHWHYLCSVYYVIFHNNLT